MSIWKPIKGVFTFWDQRSRHDPTVRYAGNALDALLPTRHRRQLGFGNLGVLGGAAGAFGGQEYASLIYVDPDNGSDSNNGLTWKKPKATITAAAAALPTGSGDDSSVPYGTLVMSVGTHTMASKIQFRQNFAVIGSGIGMNAGTAGTTIAAGDALDDHMFEALEGVSDEWNHNVYFVGITFDGNYANQTNGNVLNFCGDDSSNEITASASGKTLTLVGGGTWNANSLASGSVIRVTDSANNRGTFTLDGIPTTTVITTVEALTDVTQEEFVQIASAPYDILKFTKPGFQCFVRECRFEDAAGYAMHITKEATNFQGYLLTGSQCQQGFLYMYVQSTSNMSNIGLKGLQVDNCGPRPIHIDTDASGSSNVLSVQDAEFEAIDGDSTKHISAISINKVGASNPMIGSFSNINAYHSGGSKLGVIEPLNGNALSCFYMAVRETGYTNPVYDRGIGAGAPADMSHGSWGAGQQADAFAVGPHSLRYARSNQDLDGAATTTGYVTLSDRDNGGLYVGTASKHWRVQSAATQTAITASTTQSQGQQALTKGYFRYIVTTVGNANDVVTLPEPETGWEVIVCNRGANTLQVYPASGDDLGAGTNTSTTIAAGAVKRFLGIDNDTWDDVS